MPALNIVTVVLETVQMLAVVDVTVTVRSDDAVGETLNVLDDQARSFRAAKVIDCDAWEILKLCDAEAAGL